MKRLKYLIGSLLAAVILFGHGAVYALDIPPAPTDTSVVDQTSTLNPAQISELSATIAAEEAKSGNEIAVLMIPTLNGDSLEDYSIKVARGWGVGQKSNNNGVLLLVVKDDRKLRIEAGYGLEGALTDARSGQIIRDDITPSFKRENYYAGISNGVEAIISSIHNEYVASPSKGIDDVEDPIGLLLLLLYIGLGAFSWIVAVLARSKTWWAGGIFGFIIATAATIPISATGTRIVIVGLISLLGLGFDYAVSKNFKQRKANGDKPSWWAGGTTFGGGFGGGSGGSSGGGFGGGSFGGGGSSGSW